MIGGPLWVSAALIETVVNWGATMGSPDGSKVSPVLGRLFSGLWVMVPSAGGLRPRRSQDTLLISHHPKPLSRAWGPERHSQPDRCLWSPWVRITWVRSWLIDLSGAVSEKILQNDLSYRRAEMTASLHPWPSGWELGSGASGACRPVLHSAWVNMAARWHPWVF